MSQTFAPFNEDQVRSLNAYQHESRYHPFTCVCGDHVTLIATKDGWVCPTCSRTQNWAHTFMADWSWKITLDASILAEDKDFNTDPTIREKFNELLKSLGDKLCKSK